MQQRFMFLLALLLLCLHLQAQFVVKGKVIDDTGEGVILANIMDKDGTVATTTDFDGLFTITVSDSLVTLVVSYVGLQTTEFALKGRAEVVIEMNSESIHLEEVVVKSYKVPLIQQDNTTQGATINPNRSRRSSGRNVNRMQRKNRSGAVSIRGSRSNTTNYHVDGKRVNGRQHPPHNTEDYGLIQENRFFKVSNEPQSTFSIDVDAASYSNTRRFLKQGQRPPKDAVRIEELINYFDYAYPTPSNDEPFEVITEIAECPWQPKHKLLHVGLQGKKMTTDELPASNLTFLIDVSGSMQSSNKLPLLKSSFKLLVQQMRPEDRVAIVVYAGAAGLVLPSTSGADKAAILEAIEGLRAGGSTVGGAGIKLAYKVAQENFIKKGNNRVILATDGDFNVGASSDAEMVRLIEKKRESGVCLTVLGFGMGNYKDNKMQQLADKGNGNHAYIDELAEAKKVLVNEFGSTLFMIAKDVKIQIEFNPKQVAGYRLIGYENRLLNNEDFEDDTKDAGELGAGHTVTALYEIIPVGVSSKFLKSKSKLKYQKQVVKDNAASSKEFASIALRYKKPSGTKSQLIEKTVFDTDLNLDSTSNNFRFSAAVAQFGLLLRDSEYKGNASFEQTLQLAKTAKGEDIAAYRAGFIALVEKAQGLKKH